MRSLSFCRFHRTKISFLIRIFSRLHDDTLESSPNHLMYNCVDVFARCGRFKEGVREIRARTGFASALCYTLKDVWNMTQAKVRSVLSLFHFYSKDTVSYREYASLLVDYILQVTDHSLEDLKEVEANVIPNEEERVMLSTYDRIFNEGMEKGMKKGIEKGRKEAIEKGIEKTLQEEIENSKDTVSYREYASLLVDYILQVTNHSLEDLKEIEANFIPNEDEKCMQSTFNSIFNEGMEKGMKEGIEKGRREGIEKEIEKTLQKGIEKGRQEGIQNVILEMLKKKIDTSTIIECTGVSKDQVLQLQKQANF